MTSPAEIIDDIHNQQQFLSVLKARIQALKNNVGSPLNLGAEIGYLERMFTEFSSDCEQLHTDIQEYFYFQEEVKTNVPDEQQ